MAIVSSSRFLRRLFEINWNGSVGLVKAFSGKNKNLSFNTNNNTTTNTSNSYFDLYMVVALYPKKLWSIFVVLLALSL